MSVSQKEIGQRIRLCRQEMGISASKTALDLNISVDHYRKLESGHRIPTVEMLASLSEYYHVSTDYRLFGSSHKGDIHAELDAAIQKLIYIKKFI